jgi:formate dehydrogenase iron-sulfur subunit
VGALQKTPQGPVIYDGDKCMGCRYCMTACPYGIPRYDWEKSVPEVRKCNMCYDRLQEGKRPACVEACKHEATTFGSRKDMLEEARRRIREAPEKYIDKVFGETEVGGTSVLYISDIPLDFLGCGPELNDTPLPDLTWAALAKVPYLIGGMGAAMTGVWWIIGRRMKLADEANRASTRNEDRETPDTPHSTENDEEK